jgi:hypothetical protein
MKKFYFFICLLFAAAFFDDCWSQQIDDISPTISSAQIKLGGVLQSVSGKELCISMSSDGSRIYLGGNSGVWRSDDGGKTWWHPEHDQPHGSVIYVDSALVCPNVYDLFVAPDNDNIVLAGTGEDARVPSKSGVYRSEDGAKNWNLVHQFEKDGQFGKVCRFIAAPDDSKTIYAAGQFAIGVTTDGGITWSELKPQQFSTNDVINNIVVTAKIQGHRTLYAVGTKVWYSFDDGQTWYVDDQAALNKIRLGEPTSDYGGEPGTKALALSSMNSNIIYLCYDTSPGKICHLWKGDFTHASGSTGVQWTLLPPLYVGYANTSASGATFVVVHTDQKGKLNLIVSDARSVQYCVGEPTTTADWKRVDGDNIHGDPHSIDITSDFCFPNQSSGNSFGKIVIVNDGGAYYSTNGASNWHQGDKLSTLGIVNAVAMPDSKGSPAICMGMGDNNGFFSNDGGKTWVTQDYEGGDNDACFTDPLQSNFLYVFAPRSQPTPHEIYLYAASVGQQVNGSWGTGQRKDILSPPIITPNGPDDHPPPPWNATSGYFINGYRPLVLTLATEIPRPKGDFITIKYTRTNALLLRSTSLQNISSTNDWLTSATDETDGAKVFQQGPELPDQTIDVVQASGGHDAPIYYVKNEQSGHEKLWKWQKGMSQWQQIVPGNAVNGVNIPGVAIRFFADPYRPNILYVLDSDMIRRSDDSGKTWALDTRLRNAVTANGQFPYRVPQDANKDALINDMEFDPYNPNIRFAVGPAGVFMTSDGVNWEHLILTSAMPMRPNYAFYDPCEMVLYVSTNNRGLLRISQLAPYFEGLIGELLNASGKITMLRVNDVGTKYGPDSDQLDAEVIIKLDSKGDEAFGFQLRTGNKMKEQSAMLGLLQEAFKKDKPVSIDYSRSGCRTAEIIRVMLK